MVNEKTSLDELYGIATDAVAEVEGGEVFIVKELFRGFEWNRVLKSYRTKLGGMFLDNVNNGNIANVEALDKTPQNQQRYKKVD